MDSNTKPSMETEHLKKWNLLLSVMSIFGLKLRGKGFRLGGIVSLISTKLLVCFSVFRVIESVVDGEDFVDICLRVFFVSTQLIAVVTCYRFHLDRVKIRSLIRNVYRISGSSGIDKNRLTVRIAAILLHFVLFNTCNVLAVVLFGSDFVSDLNIKFIYEEISENSWCILYLSISFLYSVVIIMVQNLNFLFFELICQELANAFRTLRRETVEPNGDGKTIPRIIAEAGQLIECVEETRNTYSIQLFLWTVLVGGNVMLRFGRFLKFRNYNTWVHYAKIFLISNFLFFQFVKICFATSRVCEEGKALCSAIDRKSKSYCNKIQEYAFHFYMETWHEFPNFSAWGMFAVDKSLILTLAGALLTYIVIVYQFSDVK
ncbi:uncharacterized protein [Centruroides vittatus]|uniref:uncharacterized protein n=1 Tax=Centruroides vittatus TaxID=120091 RepID=UPI00350FFBC6